jgi:hypothetical protein
MQRPSELMKKHPGMEHDEPYMAHVDLGQKGTIVWTFNRAVSFEFACLIPGHFEAGMIGRINVKSECHTMKNSKPTPLPRRHWLAAAAVLALTGFERTALAQATTVQVWKDPNCGCCQLWVEHLQASGFKVEVRDVGNTAARKRLGMPEQLGSCHTATVGGYVIEGHVPATEIHRLLKERPVALGLSVPGMPIGSPGMDGPEYKGRKDAYDVLLVQKDGSTKSYQRYPGQRRMAQL